jgi:hypothetical protein
MERNAVIKQIKADLQRRSGRQWSVTGGRGTAWGWITIDAPPSRRTVHCRLKAGATGSQPEDYEEIDTAEIGGSMKFEDRQELARLLGFDKPVHSQGVSIAASNDYYEEYLVRARGEKPVKIAQPYWD